MKLEFSTDPLSDTTPAWLDVTRFLIAADWQSGVTNEFADPEAGQATFVLKNTNRRFEPEYAAGAYYPNIVPGRRFRLTATADGVNYQQGVWYAQSWQVEYPDRGSSYSTVTVTCTDGFWRLALDKLPQLTPVTAQTYSEVVAADGPIAYFPLSEDSGSKFEGNPGATGQFKAGIVYLNQTNPVVGDAEGAALFPAGTAYGRSKAEDVDVFRDARQFTLECVATVNSASDALMGFGYITASLDNQIIMQANGVLFDGNNAPAPAGISVPGTYHFAATWDGSQLRMWRNGVSGTPNSFGGVPTASDANEYFYVGNIGHGNNRSGDIVASHFAFYDYAIPASRIQAHVDAAFNRGYLAQASGTRIAALATDPLWSTAGITTGTITVTPRFQAGQTTLDEVIATARTEQPGSLFYFADNGAPFYRGIQDPQVVSAIFGDTPGEIQYDDVALVYNDELYNSSTVSGEGLEGSTAADTSSISDYGLRADDATGLLITNDADAALLSQAVVDQFSTPRFRVETITLNTASADRRTQILSREVGDTIRVRRRGEGGTPIDVITRILQKSKSARMIGGYDAHITCTWTLSRGFNASNRVDHLSVTGWSELNSNFILA